MVACAGAEPRMNAAATAPTAACQIDLVLTVIAPLKLLRISVDLLGQILTENTRRVIRWITRPPTSVSEKKMDDRVSGSVGRLTGIHRDTRHFHDYVFLPGGSPLLDHAGIFRVNMQASDMPARKRNCALPPLLVARCEIKDDCPDK